MSVEYQCEVCNYKTKRKSAFNAHNKTIKHLNKTSVPLLNTIDVHNEQINTLHYLLQKSIENQSNLIGKVGQITNHHQTTIVNLVLNEHCKNAMNLTEFLDSMSVSPDDLDYTCTNGYIKGVSNILGKHLAELHPKDRPIHCCNKLDNENKLNFFIKDNDKWEKDKLHKKMNSTIDSITKKQIRCIKEWEKVNPLWEDTDEGIILYMEMIQAIMGGITTSEKNSNVDTIKREIGLQMELQIPAAV